MVLGGDDTGVLGCEDSWTGGEEVLWLQGHAGMIKSMALPTTWTGERDSASPAL